MHVPPAFGVYIYYGTPSSFGVILSHSCFFPTRLSPPGGITMPPEPARVPRAEITHSSHHLGINSKQSDVDSLQDGYKD